MQEVNITQKEERSIHRSPSHSPAQTSSLFQPYYPYTPSIANLPSSIYSIPSVLHNSVFYPPRIDKNPSIPTPQQSDQSVVDLTNLNKFSPSRIGSELTGETAKTSIGEPFPILPCGFPNQKSIFDSSLSSFQRSGLSRLNDNFLTHLLTSSKGPQSTPGSYNSQNKNLSKDLVSHHRELFLKVSALPSPENPSFHSPPESKKAKLSAFQDFNERFPNMSILENSGKFNFKNSFDSKTDITNIEDEEMDDNTSEKTSTRKQLFNCNSFLPVSISQSNDEMKVGSEKTEDDLKEKQKFKSSTEMCADANEDIDKRSDKSRSEMFETFQAWAIKNYGDSGKTKTVTRNKYRRIIRILSGEEYFTAENSKFRFWVKAKGFQLSSKTDHSDGVSNGDKILLVPSKDGHDGRGGKTLKRVAVVENFFDIIYNVHVEMDGRGGKHAGQKRTYRAIAKTYSFLPREAVTRFLMSCTDCQKRMHLSLENNNNNNDNKSLTSLSSPALESNHDSNTEGMEHSGLKSSSSTDYYVPITQTYLSRMRQSTNPIPYINAHHDEDSMSSDSTANRDVSPSPKTEEESIDALPRNTGSGHSTGGTPMFEVLQSLPLLSKDNSVLEEPHDMSSRKASPQISDLEIRASESPIDLNSRKASPISGKLIEGKSHNERKRRASSESGDSAMTKTSEGKDDDDDDDNDDDERIPVGHNIDPERLKSFNMFVRLFVDENLDRMVPISKQPKDKVQAILEACDRQFPEFHERSRKRIRTYLKSCRRMRRSKDHNGWEPLRPTPPHLTSAAAESLLATACENESQNAKRMRMGLEPLTSSEMAAQNMLTNNQTTPTTQQQPSVAAPPPPSNNGSQTPSQPASRPVNCSVPTATDFLRHQPHPTAFHPTPEFTPSFFTNGHGTAAAAAALFRPGFPGYQHPAHHHPSVLQHSSITPTPSTNGEFGPTDLSMKKSNSKGQLSPSEVTAIKQLIAGYKESAAFLYRSADELEQLLLQQN